MKPCHRCFTIIAAGMTELVPTAFQKNLVFFFTLSQIVVNKALTGLGSPVGCMIEDVSVKPRSNVNNARAGARR